MKQMLISTLAAALTSTVALALPPAGAPAGTTGMCNDGSYSSNAEKKGACSGHKGVKEWYGGEASKGTAPEGPRATAAPATTTMPAATATPANEKPAMAKSSQSPGMAPAPGGGSGKVWANTSTKVYHCSGDKYYGTTKHGEYMSEADAKAKGYHADHGKACG